MIGSRLGPYEITAKLGEGGMGEVCRATDTKLKREVAIKVLPAALPIARQIAEALEAARAMSLASGSRLGPYEITARVTPSASPLVIC
ncbi:MAG: hypothetical protein ABI609_01290 [Acidobacteriota bacterium]